MFGAYPSIMRSILKNRLPTLTESEAKTVKGSFDFIGLNHYTARYTLNQPNVSFKSPFGREFDDTGAAPSCMTLPSLLLIGI